MTDEIRRALEARVAASAGSAARQERIRARIAELEKEEEPVRKRKWPSAMALVLAAVLLCGTGLAAGLRLNLFELLSKSTPVNESKWEQDQIKLRSLREKNTLISTSVSAPEGVHPEKMIQVHDAYYDGNVLLVGYIQGENEWFDPFVEWTPTEEELARFDEPPILRQKDGHYLFSETADSILREAIRTGQPCGIKAYGISGYRVFETTDGQRLWVGNTNYAEPVGTDSLSCYAVEQFASPLPEAIRGRDVIDIQMPFTFNTEYFWFDGNELYTWFGPEEYAMLTVTIGRDQDAPAGGRYGSETISLNGAELTVEAEAFGPYQLRVVMSADEPYFLPAMGPVRWNAYDEAGRELSMSVSVYDEAGMLLEPMVWKIIFNLGRKTEYAFAFYDACSEDGLTKELLLDLVGEVPETLTVVITQDDAEAATVTLRLAE
ncbi:MAG: hypothetical protein J1E43_01820 [Christensenellaceae bacterium]|nr:hypothetical protein [Christensenellaceae bacterium]